MRTKFVSIIDDFRRYPKHKFLILMMMPGLLYFVIFKYIPIYGLMIAFKDYYFELGINGSPWVGFEHFEFMFSLGSFWEVVRNTFTISLLQLMFFFPSSIIFALLLNEIGNVHFKKFAQTVSYLPHFISWVVLGGIFTQLLAPTTGPVNIILRDLGITKAPINFLTDPVWFRYVLVATHIWKDVGWASIIYLAALTAVSPELYEAATIDGANRFQKIKNVALPAITPVITIMLIVQIGKVVNDNFEQIFNLYNPAVYKVGDVISTYVYRMGMKDMEYSFSTAVGLFKNVIAFTLVMITNKISQRVNEYGLW